MDTGIIFSFSTKKVSSNSKNSPRWIAKPLSANHLLEHNHDKNICNRNTKKEIDENDH